MRICFPILLCLALATPAWSADAEESLQQAESLIEQGLPAEALAPLREAARAAPDDVAVQRRYMELMKSQGYGRDVAAEFQARIERRPDDALSHYLIGVALGDPKTAKLAFERALELDPTHKFARQGLGSVAVAQGRFDDALTEYAAALVLDPQFAEVHNKVANLHAARGDSDLAKAAWKKAMEAAPDDYHAWMNMGAVLSMEGDLDGAAELLGEAVRRAPGHARAHFNYGYVLFKIDRHDDALAHFAAALAINPRDRTVRGTQVLVQAVRDGDVPATAIDPYEQAVASMLTDPSIAAQKYKEVLMLAPDFAFAHMNLGVAHAALGEVVDAEQSLKKATELGPEDADTWRNLGMFYLMVQRFPDAVPALQTAHGLDPSDPQLLGALANAQFTSGDAGAASSSYRRALKLRPRDPELHVELAAAQAASGYLDSAATSARDALEIAPDLVPARVQLVAILREARRFDEALRELAVLEKQIPNHPDIVSERTAIEARRSAHKSEAGAGKLRLARILVATEDDAIQLVVRARAGEDFSALARKHSEGREAPRGGDIGYVQAADLRPELAAAVDGLSAGQISQPVDLGGTWMILKRTE
jgi:tetratricopeptide (TPR) repeat protein